MPSQLCYTLYVLGDEDARTKFEEYVKRQERTVSKERYKAVGDDMFDTSVWG